jgi:hypothetical protein
MPLPDPSGRTAPRTLRKATSRIKTASSAKHFREPCRLLSPRAAVSLGIATILVEKQARDSAAHWYGG